jgi:hypothetical protein
MTAGVPETQLHTQSEDRRDRRDTETWTLGVTDLGAGGPLGVPRALQAGAANRWGS